jgi:hypothetical protein
MSPVAHLPLSPCAHFPDQFPLPQPQPRPDYTVNPQRMAYGWTSNNSVFATLGMDYGPICERVRKNGEPGFAWLSNMQVRKWHDGGRSVRLAVRAIGELTSPPLLLLLSLFDRSSSHSLPRTLHTTRSTAA